MYSKNKNTRGFPDPLAKQEVKASKEYGLKYAKAIENQWGDFANSESLYRRRNKIFEKNREYANGTQDTTIYKQLLNSLDPNNADGSLVNLDYTPVPILPKFAKIVSNKILSRNPYPNLEAIDPISSSEKNDEKSRIRNQVKMREKLQALKQMTGGLVLDEDPDKLPETLEEAEILIDTNVKTDAEMAAQVATNLTLSWNDFNDNTYRRSVNDLTALGMSVVKRSNDPNYGIKVDYVDPIDFIHSYTEDPGMNDLMYAGHMKRISISELKRLAGDQLEEKDYEELAKTSTKYQYGSGNKGYFDNTSNRMKYEYDDYMIEVLEFEFISVDCIFYEEKDNRHGNTGFYHQGFKYKERAGSVFERKPHKMEVSMVYGGVYITGTKHIFNYGMKTNIPRNMHDLSKCRLSYSAVSTNMRRMIPKSMVNSCIGFADMLQLTHLKIQQAIAKAKPDGLIIDIEGLENVQLGNGGELQPLDLHDIYEQTGVFYYRSKNPEGGFQNPPVREIGNSIRNINELVGLYNHYLRMIRDTTGINEMMDASTPKGDTLVGVQQNAIAAGNNAIYDITNAAMILFKKTCEDIVKCLQIIPLESVLFKTYTNAIGKTNMDILSSFSDLPMYNFGVRVVKEMEDQDKIYLEQSIQASLAQKEIDLEDAIAIRSIKDITQAERLLVLRRKKRIERMQKQAAENAKVQAEQAQAAAQAASQGRMQELQLQSQLEAQTMQMKAQIEMQMEQVKHEYRKEIEMIRAQATLGFRTEEQEFKEKLEVLKEDRKDDRVEKQAVEQSKLISQRKGKRQELQEQPKESVNLSQLL